MEQREVMHTERGRETDWQSRAIIDTRAVKEVRQEGIRVALVGEVGGDAHSQEKAKN